MASKFLIFASRFPLDKVKEKDIFLPSAWFVFTMKSFHGSYSSFEFLVYIPFSSCQYVCIGVKYQQIENIQFVDGELLPWEKVKTLIRSNPFDAKEEWIQFKRIGNNFWYYSSEGTIFFWRYFPKIECDFLGGFGKWRYSLKYASNPGGVNESLER